MIKVTIVTVCGQDTALRPLPHVQNVFEAPDDLPPDFLGEFMVEAMRAAFKEWPKAKPDQLTTVVTYLTQPA